MKCKIVEYGNGTFGIHKKKFFFIEMVWSITAKKWIPYAWVAGEDLNEFLNDHRFKTVEDAQECIWNDIRSSKRPKKPNEFDRVATVRVNHAEMKTSWGGGKNETRFILGRYQ